MRRDRLIHRRVLRSARHDGGAGGPSSGGDQFTRRRVAAFERLEIDSEEVTGQQLTEPFAQLLAHDLIAETFRRSLAAPEPFERSEVGDGLEAAQEAGAGRVLACAGAGAPAAASPVGGVTNPVAPQASAVTVPTSWVITAGTAATFPVPRR